MTLDQVVRRACARDPDAIAVVAPDGAVRYRELDAAADRCAAGLHALGVRRGDRVALWGPKSTRQVAAMQGVLRLGAAYVPIDPQAPPLRARALTMDCDARAVVTDAARAGGLGEPAPALLLTDDEVTAGRRVMGWSDLATCAPAPSVSPSDDELAYILYTSGSTGQPKGVCLSHRNALAFVEWAREELALAPSDVLSNHAPFHFDLSVLDLYGAFAAGGRVCLLGEGSAYAPRALVEMLRDQRITVWYSVPSVLILMMEHGGLLGTALPSLRALLFAGEVFPVKHLRPLRAHLPPPVRFLNLYGPTETNVCTFYEVGTISDARTEPVPIGKACSGDRTWVRTNDGPTDGEGELMVEGPTVMLGYWGQTAQQGAYATGDLVRTDEKGDYVYLGRRDQMVKLRGQRIEPGEIEATLLGHSDLSEAAVTVAGAGVEARLVAFATLAPGARRPSLLAMKELCARRLPRAMIVDEVRWVDALPRTSNGKVDRVRLAGWARSGGQ
jgi:amino acid adenylation domain-containing protein